MDINVYEKKLYESIPSVKNISKEIKKVKTRPDFAIIIANDYGCKTFLFCVKHGLLDVLKMFVKRLNAERLFNYICPESGDDALSVGIRFFKHDVVEWMLGFGELKVDKRDILGRTAFFKAILWNNFSCAKLLMQFGCNIYVPNDQGETIFEFVVYLNNDSRYKQNLKGINQFIDMIRLNTIHGHFLRT